jgi:hypothetical protein
MHMARCLLIGLLLPVLLHGQVSNSNDCSRRSIPLAVLDHDYRFIDDLKPLSLRVKAGDHTLTVDHVSRTSPRRMMLLLDVSGSMVQRNKWHVLQLLAHDVVASAPPEIEIALSTFENEYRPVLGYSRDRDAVRGALGTLTYDSLKLQKVVGGTSLLDALLNATRQDAGLSFGDVIYILTDGYDNRSRSKRRDVRNQLLQSGIRAYFFFLRERVEMSIHTDISDLRRLATVSGGYVIDLISSEPYGGTEFYYDLDKENLRNLAAAARILYLPMFNSYSMEIDVPDSLQSLSSKLKIVVFDERGKTMKNVQVIHPQELLRCSAPAQVIAP